MKTFLDAAGKQAKEQEATFQARAEAQRKAWQESMDKLREAAASFTADRRADIETALKHMKTEADAAKVKFDKLNKASGKSWAAMNSALTETRATMDRANQAATTLSIALLDASVADCAALNKWASRWWGAGLAPL